MTTPPATHLLIANFQRAVGVEVRAATAAADGGETLVQIAARSGECESALALIFDLSDSSNTTARLVGRLPSLLAGWPREGAVWVYALGDTRPLPGIAAGNIGHVQDGGLDLLQPFGDRAMLDRYRSCGSFLGPTMDALYERIKSEALGQLHVVVIGDGQLTDFGRIDLPPSISLLGLIESAADRRGARWREVVGDAPILSFEDRRLEEWFAARRVRSASHRWIRVVTRAGVSARRIDPDGSSDRLSDAWFEYDFRFGPLRLAVAGRCADWQIEARTVGGGVETLNGSSVAASSDLSEEAWRAFHPSGPATSMASVVVGLDTRADGAGAHAAWHAATRAFELAANNRAWGTDITSVLNPVAEAAALLCLANRVPAGPYSKQDRVIVLALPTQDDALTWTADQPLAFGEPTVGWSVRYDRFEDRWMLRIRGGSPPLATQETALHPSASQLLPAIPLRGGGVWIVAFSGPLRSDE